MRKNFPVFNEGDQISRRDTYEIRISKLLRRLTLNAGKRGKYHTGKGEGCVGKFLLISLMFVYIQRCKVIYGNYGTLVFDHSLVELCHDKRPYQHAARLLAHHSCSCFFGYYIYISCCDSLLVLIPVACVLSYSVTPGKC